MITAQPPFARPPPLTAEATSFYDHELDAFNAILEQPYADFSLENAQFVIANGELFVPALYLRYLFPAVAEAGRALVAASPGPLEFEQLARLVVAAAPIEPFAPIADRLRAALGAASVSARPMSSYLEVPAPLGAPYPSGHGEARLLAFLLEVQGDAAGNRELLTSEAPSFQTTVLHMSRGVLEGGWQLRNPSAAALWTLESTIARLERLKNSTDAMVALAARFVLGEVDRSDLPLCGDPECKAHSKL